MNVAQFLARDKYTGKKLGGEKPAKKISGNMAFKSGCLQFIQGWKKAL